MQEAEQIVKMDIRIEQNMNRCQEAWNAVSPNKSMEDLWAFRSMWNTFEQGNPYFIIASYDQEPIGVLPMAYFPKYQKYWWFGGGFWLERSHCLIKSSEWRPLVLPLLYKYVPKNAHLLWIEPTENALYPAVIINGLQPHDPTYSLMCKELAGNIENLFNMMSSKSGKSIRRSIRKIKEDFHPETSYGSPDDLETLINFSIQRFDSECTLHDPFVRGILPLMLSTPGVREHVHIVNISIADRIVASTIVIYYNGVYTFYQGGYDPSIPDLNKYEVYTLIEDALQLGAYRFDALSGDCGWKDRWHLEKNLLWQYVT